MLAVVPATPVKDVCQVEAADDARFGTGQWVVAYASFDLLVDVILSPYRHFADRRACGDE